MIRLEITGDTAADFNVEFSKVLGVFLPMLRSVQPAPKQEPSAQSHAPVRNETVVEQPKAEPEVIPPEKPKATKPKKAEPKQTDIVDAVANTYTIKEVRDSLKLLGEKKGHDAVYELLKDFDAKKASEIAEDRYAEVIGRVSKILEG